MLYQFDLHLQLNTHTRISCFIHESGHRRWKGKGMSIGQSDKILKLWLVKME